MDLLNILIERVKDMVAGFVRMLPQLLIALLVIAFTWLVANLARAVVTRVSKGAGLRPSLVALFATLAGIVAWVFGILVALAVLLPGVTAGSLLTVVGFTSVAIGFAFKDIFENFLAGILIMLRKKMRIGDHIECEGVEGRIEKITLRDTHLRKLTNELTIVPNGYLFRNPVRIITDADLRRYELVVGVDYATDLDQAVEVMQAAVRKLELVTRVKPVEVYAREFADSSIEFTVRWWSGSKMIDMHKSRDQVVRAIKRALDAAGIEIPFPQLTATVRAQPSEQSDVQSAEDGPRPRAAVK